MSMQLRFQTGFDWRLHNQTYDRRQQICGAAQWLRYAQFRDIGRRHPAVSDRFLTESGSTGGFQRAP
jgi:hypothetical protein